MTETEKIEYNSLGYKIVSNVNKLGKPHGPNITYYKSGQIFVEENWVNGKIDGPRKTWYENGEKSGLVNHKKGFLNGPYEFWHENGQKNRKKTYVNNRIVGESNGWYEDGQKEFEEYYNKKGNKEGKCTYWLMNGELNRELNYNNGIWDGDASKWQYNCELVEGWHDNEVLEYRGYNHHLKDDYDRFTGLYEIKKVGLWKHFYESGNRKEKSSYDEEGNIIFLNKWYENGYKYNETIFRPHYKSYLWDEDGEIISMSSGAIVGGESIPRWEMTKKHLKELDQTSKSIK